HEARGTRHEAEDNTVIHHGGDEDVVALAMGQRVVTWNEDAVALAMGQRGVLAWSSVRHTSPDEAPPPAPGQAHARRLGVLVQHRPPTPAAPGPGRNAPARPAPAGRAR